MTQLELAPLIFAPIFMERVWGGRRLQSFFHKQLPPDVPIGESWEIVDRPEAQSVVLRGSWRGQSLHHLWQNKRDEIFGDIADAERFPILVKILDAREKLSLQVHPPRAIAAELGGEPKTEFWYITQADPAAEIFVGLKKQSSRGKIEEALARGTIAAHAHRLPVQTGDAMFLPSGRMHAIGAGNVIIEVQENSDTTYRVFDWNRCDGQGAPRKLHLEQSMRSIDFNDHEPDLISPMGEVLVRHSLFVVEKWELSAEREAVVFGTFAIIACLSGEIVCAGITLRPGEFFLIPAPLKDRVLRPLAKNTALLRITVPAPQV